MRYELSDDEWATIRPMLPHKARGVPRADDRRVLNGIFWVLRSGAPWRDLPSSFGPYTTCYNRGEAHDNRLAGKLLSRLKSGAMLLADRGYDADWIRALISRHGAWANIPPRRNRKDALCFSPYLYRARNLVERFFNKIKQCRRVATRYGKLAANYLAFVQLASIRLWLRVNESTP
jgi:transposase